MAEAITSLFAEQFNKSIERICWMSLNLNESINHWTSPATYTALLVYNFALLHH